MSYIYLALAVVAEVIGTSLLKSTDEFTKLTPTAVVVVCYIVAMWLLTLVLREMAVGIVYAIWSCIIFPKSIKQKFWDLIH